MATDTADALERSAKLPSGVSSRSEEELCDMFGREGTKRSIWGSV
jgi:hypothetical protein